MGKTHRKLLLPKIKTLHYNLKLNIYYVMPRKNKGKKSQEQSTE